LKKTPLDKITGSREMITSSDWFIPSPKDENILVFTQLVPGTKLFENTFGEPNTALFIYNLKEDKKTRLTPENMFAVDPIWSINGENIYFTGYYDKNGRENYPFRIFKIKIDGSGLTEITKGENVDN
jgi:Tol biopolymer transport system component